MHSIGIVHHMEPIQCFQPLSHQGKTKMGVILQTTFVIFFFKAILSFWVKFRLTISQYCFLQWLRTGQVKNHHL